MSKNLLAALANIVENPISELSERYKSINRINSVGDALEFYIKDIFCNTISEEDINIKNRAYNECFSYIGNQNNPPDLIVKSGDAIEVKKIGGKNSGIPLNSSYPKSKLHSDDPMILEACKRCEDWTVKDIIYAIGIVRNNKIISLWFIYGDCYAADKEVYERIRQKISEGVNSIEGVEFSRTKELGRVNKVDPLGITYLRIRGMWGIENPYKVFNYISQLRNDGSFNVNAIMLKSKYEAFPEDDRQRIEKLIGNNLSISDTQIKSPNNPANLIDIKAISFSK
jgi:hypothetical protein